MASPVAANINSLRQMPGALDPRPRTPGVAGGAEDSLFKDQLAALQNVVPSAAASAPAGTQVAGMTGLKFSNHAIDRMQSRGIRFSPDDMMKIEGAINKAAGKGAKDTLLLTDNSALIVSVKDKTIVTVMDKASLKDNVFTKIDSTVVI